ncbi:hypothetical protein H0H93_016771 [Arthromyces matolae]|nr:hypothetical protein H0H93_016771 [Arthromyces matolae]
MNSNFSFTARLIRNQYKILRSALCSVDDDDDVPDEFYLGKDENGSDDESTEESNSSHHGEAEGLASGSGKKNLVGFSYDLTDACMRASGVERDFNAFPPRICLLGLPTEIIEQIATCLRYPLPVLDAASRYIDDRYSDFADARFALSAYSKTCSTIRPIVERVLYRDIQLDFTGWKGRKHTQWPAASLYLLLPTLKTRPQLGKLIRTAALDYQLSTESNALEDALEDFLELTPNLRTLYLWQCPLALWNFAPHKITTFATTFAPDIIHSILNNFPQLENLYLRDCSVMGFTLDLPRHNLKTVRLASNHHNAAAHLTRALALCSKSATHLDVRFIGGFLHQSPAFDPKVDHVPPSPATSLRSLRLDNISVFSHVNSAYTQVLQSLTALEHLHLSHHSCFDSGAFKLLPPALHKLTVSDYYGSWETRPVKKEPEFKNKDFMLSLAKCIATLVPSTISLITISPGIDKEEDLSYDLVLTICEWGKIKSHLAEDKTEFVELLVSFFAFVATVCIYWIISFQELLEGWMAFTGVPVLYTPLITDLECVDMSFSRCQHFDMSVSNMSTINSTTQATALSGRASLLPLSYDTRIVLPLHAHQHIIVSKQGIQDMLFKAGILRRFAIQAGFEESFIQKRPHLIVEVIHFYLNLENSIPSSVMSAITSILLPFPVYFHTLNGCTKPEFQESYSEPVEFDPSPQVPWAGHSFKKISQLDVTKGILKQEAEHNNSQRHETVRQNPEPGITGCYKATMNSDIVTGVDAHPFFHVDGVFKVEIEGPFTGSNPYDRMFWHLVKIEDLHVWTPESSPYNIVGCETALLREDVQNTQHSFEIPQSGHTRSKGMHRIWEPIIKEQVDRRKKKLSDFVDLNDFCYKVTQEFSRRGTAEAEVLVLWSSNPETVLPDATSIDSIPPFATIAHLSSLALDFTSLDTGNLMRTSTDLSKVIRMDFDNVVSGGAQDVQTLSFCPVTGQPTPKDTLSVDSQSTVCKSPEETPNNNLSVDSESTVCKLPEETPNDNSNIDSESTVCKPSEETPCPPASSSESTASKPPGKTPWYTRLYHLLPGQGKKN